MLDLLPENLPAPKPLPAFYPAVGTPRARIAFLAGCVQQVLDPEINWATLRVLARNGVEVIVPAGQGCCGALLMHTGNLADARNLASKNMRIFPQDVDAILTNAAGCGSGMKEYAQLFHGEPEEKAAQIFSKQVVDVSAFLAELGIIPTPAMAQPMKIAYHDACHLAHAQGVRQAPRDLLKSIPNLDLIEMNESDMCCGSAGTYNLQQPEIAASLGRRKAENIRNTNPRRW
jgi:glycolate oxidase iron-sulfur subunit